MPTDVIIVGAGLAGLACAHDLLASGADVVVVEARERTGGRVESVTLDDGRSVELGGELVGDVHPAYLGLAAELGLETEPSYVAEPGEDAWDLVDGVVLGEGWLDEADGAALAQTEAELVRLAGTVDPADPWSHPDAGSLDALSIGDLLRQNGGTPNAHRAADIQSRSTGAGTIERLSVLALVRAMAAVGGAPLSDYSSWESMRLRGGSSTLVRALTASLGERIRYGAPVARMSVGDPCTVELPGGEELSAAAIVCAVPCGPLRAIEITGLSDERLRSLHRQQHLMASKAVIALDEPVWRATGWNGLCSSERDVGGFWIQGGTTLSSLFGPEQRAYLDAMPPERQTATVVAALERLVGPVEPRAVLWRHWGTDPYTLGYLSHWAPGELMAVGPLHGTHEPPFYVAGSDHWAAGYMEGAVATGRAAARSIITAATAPIYTV